MPFNINSGAYSPPAGATNATTGQVIQSAVWNTVHSDIAAALSQIGENGGLFPVGIVAFAHSVVLTATGDVATLVPIVPSSVNWVPQSMYYFNVGSAPATVVYGIFTGAGATGVTVVPVSSFTISAAGVATAGAFSNTSQGNINQIVLNGGTNLIFRVATVQPTGTVSIWVRGQVLP